MNILNRLSVESVSPGEQYAEKTSCFVEKRGCTMAKIVSINQDMIVFSDGSRITYNHEQDCCENNYADFEQLDDLARGSTFDIDNMIFEAIPHSGFRFGNSGAMFFVPCYSEQNGYYTDEIDIYFKGSRVLSFDCEPVYQS